MNRYVVQGKKEMANGTLHTIREVFHSRTKAEWARANYVAYGYHAEILEEDEGILSRDES